MDRDGRFTLFFSGRLDRLAGNAALSGFVHTADFYRDLAAPFGNRSDMMYLNTDLQPGPYFPRRHGPRLRPAVVPSDCVLDQYLPSRRQAGDEA